MSRPDNAVLLTGDRKPQPASEFQTGDDCFIPNSKHSQGHCFIIPSLWPKHFKMNFLQIYKLFLETVKFPDVPCDVTSHLSLKKWLVSIAQTGDVIHLFNLIRKHLHSLYLISIFFVWKWCDGSQKESFPLFSSFSTTQSRSIEFFSLQISVCFFEGRVQITECSVKKGRRYQEPLVLT